MRWQILNKIKSKRTKERREEILRVLFKNRGLKTKKQQEEFLNPKAPQELTLGEVGLSSVQIIKATKRIKLAIKNKEKIVIYGDYDADGICATAVVWEALHNLGAEVMPFIPKREEGYGLKISRIDQMVKEGVKLIITVDQGIVNLRQVKHARQKGIDVIITDHHLPGKKKPRATAIIHTTQLAGVGVAWFFIRELRKHLRGVYSCLAGRQAATSEVARQIRKAIPDRESPYSIRDRSSDFLDLATIGTVTDVVPLVGPNRSLVKFGLRALRKTKRKGLLSLYQLAGINKENIETYEVGFIIGPRLNAAGRMDDSMESLRLICTQDRERALVLAKKLDQANRERQILTEETLLHARKLWLKEDGQSALIFVSHESYQEGVIGLVAAKLKEEFYRPAIVFSQGEKWSKASVRSIEEFNVIEAIRECADILEAYGGHRLAAGFSVDSTKMDELRKRLINRANELLDKEKLRRTLKIDTRVELADLNFKLYQQIQKFAPFGMGNPQPVFATRKVKVDEARTVGKDGQHLKIKFVLIPTSHFPTHFPLLTPTLDAIAFNMGHLYSRLSPERPINIAYNLLLDTWNDQKKLQLRIKDIRV